MYEYGGANILFTAVVILVAILTVSLIVARLYHRASKELSFVRTGFGGQKVIMNGGALVLPVLHETIPVNMNTLRLEVHRANEQALITKDRMRVDVLAEFYVRVKPELESIAAAAQTLGRRTIDHGALKDLIEGKFVDALRAVAAEMAMEDLHEQRVDFVQKVQQAVAEDLLKNGLELESVSLTGLDQTSKQYFNPDNAFDAEGLTKLTEEIELRRKKRNDIEQETKVLIQTKNLEAERQRLELSKEEEYARLQQEREIEVRRAAQVAEIAREQAQKKQEAEQAQIRAEQEVEASRIAKEQEVRSREIEKNRTIEASEIEKRKTLELAEQIRAIAIAEKSKDQSVAEAAASLALAESVAAEEKVTTARDTEIAERQKLIELVEARKQAERDAISITLRAEAEKQAAEDLAEAERIKAQGTSDHARITAEGAAEAEKLAAQAAAARYEVDAAGKRAINESANILSAEQIAMQVKVELIKALPDIIRESVRPMERIDGIKIVQVEGLNGNGKADGASAAHGHSQGNLADQVVNSAMRYRAQAPLIDSLMQELGLNGNSLNGLAGTGLVDTAEPQTEN